MEYFSIDNPEENKKDKLSKKIILAQEFMKSKESFAFPGIKEESYQTIKKQEEEYPGCATPIDELLERFNREGFKVTLGKFPESGNVFVLPFHSDDIENDNLLPRHLNIEGISDSQMKEFIMLSS